MEGVLARGGGVGVGVGVGQEAGLSFPNAGAAAHTEEATGEVLGGRNEARDAVFLRGGAMDCGWTDLAARIIVRPAPSVSSSAMESAD
jgi:hypothetical protein